MHSADAERLGVTSCSSTEPLPAWAVGACPNCGDPLTEQQAETFCHNCAYIEERDSDPLLQAEDGALGCWNSYVDAEAAAIDAAHRLNVIKDPVRSTMGNLNAEAKADAEAYARGRIDEAEFMRRKDLRKTRSRRATGALQQTVKGYVVAHNELVALRHEHARAAHDLRFLKAVRGCGAQRHRRAPGSRTVRRRGSRRASGVRSSQDPGDSDPPGLVRNPAPGWALTHALTGDVS